MFEGTIPAFAGDTEEDHEKQLHFGRDQKWELPEYKF